MDGVMVNDVAGLGVSGVVGLGGSGVEESPLFVEGCGADPASLELEDGDPEAASALPGSRGGLPVAPAGATGTYIVR
jgi:hypothetical protein